jgi:hypothetical protein
MHSWSIFGAWMSHGQTRTHNTRHGLDLGEATTYSLVIFFVLDHGACTQMLFCPRIPKLGVPKLFKLGLLQLWRPITFCANFRLKWGPKKSCNLCQEHSNDMWHATYTQVNQGNFWLLVVGSQIDNLILDLSFGHNLCFKYPNGSCETNLNIYFPWKI